MSLGSVPLPNLSKLTESLANLEPWIFALALISASTIVPSNIFADVICPSLISVEVVCWFFSCAEKRSNLWLLFKSAALIEEPATKVAESASSNAVSLYIRTPLVEEPDTEACLNITLVPLTVYSFVFAGGLEVV